MYRPGNVRILSIANHLGSRGGLERTQLANCRGLAARGHTIDLIYVSEGDFADEWRSFTRNMVKVAGTLPRRRQPVSTTVGVGSALLTARRLAPEVLYAYRYWDLPFCAASSEASGAKVVHHLCLPPPRWIPWWLRSALRRVDATVSVSRDTAERWREHGLDPARVTVALTAVDLHRYRPGSDESRHATRRELGVEPGELLVLYAGRIDREKGVDILVKAFTRLMSMTPGCRLVLVGSASLGSDPADSQLYLNELEADARGAPVIFLPGRADVVPLVQAADVCVVPSLWPEPLSRAVIEPIACGVPVVATNVGGTPEILTDWLARFLVKPGDPDALAERLAELRSWRQDDPELGQRLRRSAEARLSLDEEVQKIEGAMQHALGGGQRSRWRTISSSEAGS